MHGLNVVKIKIYNLAGMVVYSTEAEQIGVVNSQYARFLRVRSGKIASEIETHLDEKGVEQNVLSSYIPIREQAYLPVEAVFELYTDITVLMAQLQKTQR